MKAFECNAALQAATQQKKPKGKRAAFQKGSVPWGLLGQALPTKAVQKHLGLGTHISDTIGPQVEKLQPSSAQLPTVPSTVSPVSSESGLRDQPMSAAEDAPTTSYMKSADGKAEPTTGASAATATQQATDTCHGLLPAGEQTQASLTFACYSSYQQAEADALYGVTALLT